MVYKPEIRKRIRARREKMNPISIQQAALQVAAQLIHLPKLIESKHIGYYLPDEGEVDPHPIIQCQEHQHKQFYLPVVGPGTDKLLVYYPHQINEPLSPNRFGILEPKTDGKKPVNILHLDLIFVPLVSFDKHCNRIGRGAGYYDHTFAFAKQPSVSKRPLLVGLAYEFQKIDTMVPSALDVPMDMIVTESEIYRRY